MSYHIIVDILTNREVNKHIAKLLNAKIGSYPILDLNKSGTQKHSGVVDCGVYSKNHTMRLPNCVKIVDGVVENRKLKILQGSTLTDFVISDTRGITIKYLDLISISEKCPISDAKQFNSTANEESVK